MCCRGSFKLFYMLSKIAQDNLVFVVAQCTLVIAVCLPCCLILIKSKLIQHISLCTTNVPIKLRPIQSNLATHTKFLILLLSNNEFVSYSLKSCTKSIRGSIYNLNKIHSVPDNTTAWHCDKDVVITSGRAVDHYLVELSK